MLQKKIQIAAACRLQRFFRAPTICLVIATYAIFSYLYCIKVFKQKFLKFLLILCTTHQFLKFTCQVYLAHSMKLPTCINHHTSNSGCFFKASAMLADASAPIVLPSSLNECTVLVSLIAFTISAAAKMNENETNCRL